MCSFEAWGTKAKKPHIFRNIVVFGLVAEGGKANKPVFSSQSHVCWPWYPRPPKNHLAKKPLRDPSGGRVRALLVAVREGSALPAISPSF